MSKESEKNNIIEDKSFAFGVRCIKLYVYLKDHKREYDLSRQLLRSGTSIGANIKEGVYAQSRADFLAKLSIAKKEAVESEYWLRLLEAGRERLLFPLRFSLLFFAIQGILFTPFYLKLISIQYVG